MSRYEEDIIALCQKYGMCVDIIDFENYDGNSFNHDIIILSGGHCMTIEGNEEYFAGQIKLLQSVAVPVIGICLGFEIIVKAFGGKLIEMPINEKCELTIKKLVDDDIFSGINKIKAYENHKWKVKDLPYSLMPLATSCYGVEIVKHISEPIYGFQFHPEESKFEDCGLKLFENIFTKLRAGIL